MDSCIEYALSPALHVLGRFVINLLLFSKMFGLAMLMETTGINAIFDQTVHTPWSKSSDLEIDTSSSAIEV